MRIKIIAFALVAACVGNLARAIEPPSEIRFTVESFEVTGPNPLGAERTERVLEPYTGEHLGLEGLQAAADALQQILSRQGHRFHRVILPPQTLREGIVTLKVVPFELGGVEIDGNQYFSDANILNSLPPLVPGRVPNLNALARARGIANEHPAKQLRLKFRESRREDAVDAVLTVEDAPPGSVFTLLQNTGTEESGEWRLSLGYQHQNLFDRDHGLSVVYTTAADDTDAVSQYGLNYRWPMYGHGGTLSFHYSQSDVDSGTVQEFFEVKGSGTVGGFRYRYPFSVSGRYRHDLGVGYDDKLFEDNVQFLGMPIGTDVRSNPLTLRYGGRWQWLKTGLGFDLTAVANQPGGSHSDEITYNTARHGADPEWTAWRYRLSWDYRFAGGWLLQFNGDGQLGGEPLVPGEQFGLGGAHSVRGFDERAILGDSGWQAGLEVWTPPLVSQAVYLLWFYDLGESSLETVDTSGVGLEAVELASTGVGLRWQWDARLNLRLDAALVRENSLNPDGGQLQYPEAGDSKIHFGMFYRF